ncbi:uncharacterized protein LOC105196709 isoform X2 [Solenopsis invicta]|uniref:uncharacterized protein LOC105196709 isoform X2 n=1 Tax=Solenopsis invicta TaxID=13686 RepID=UPI000595D305|nr:uncharacterized protein LOC105196709 isoform X2 [Solenopsis invicta]XP_025990685.1 uncharacterized protein LOC105196709 isoform X2 [Solenopsis invicta]XP_025990688.1 uncharacterized protein LOC105196709 isoform X2 [Solenopsis invicta]
MIWLLFFLIHEISASNGNVILRELGEKEYTLIKAKSSLPQHGMCWHTALQALESNCDKLNDQEHSLLALRLANCFLEDSGHATCNCHLSETENERRKCIGGMADREFNVYNEFYTHATHICFFLNHEAWQAEVDNTIKLLFQVSSRMKDQLLEASEMQGIILNSQKEGLRIQNELLDHGKELGTVLKTSSETVGNMVSDFKKSAKDQKELLYEIFSYIRTFQSWIIGEVSWFQSIIFYTVSCILCALFSSSKRTVDARITLFSILSLNIVAERMLVQYYDKITFQSPDDKVHLLSTTWLYRKIALTLCVVTLFCTYYYYKDEHLENYKALQRIEQQLDGIQQTVVISNIEPIRYSKRLAMKRLHTVSNKRENIIDIKNDK